MNRTSMATVALPTLTIVGAVGFLIAVRSRLPDDVATHWGGGGVADGFTDRDALPWLFAGLAVIIMGLLATINLVSDRAVIGLRPLRAMPMAVVSFLTAIVIATAAVQIDADDVPDFPGWSIPVALLAAVVGGSVAAWIAGPASAPPESTAPAPADAPRIELAEGHTAVWSGRTPASTVMPVFAVAVTVLALVISAVASWWLLLIFVPLVFLLIASSTYDVTLGRRGLRVAGAIVGFPRVRVPLAEVASVEAGTVEASSFGGWGIRTSLSGESAVITRTGPALVVHRTDGAVLRVSLDEPEEVAAVFSTLLDRRR